MTQPDATERDFPIHTAASAPEGSQEPLAWYLDTFGMVPNLAAVLAESPALLTSYWQTQNNLLADAALTRQEINIVQTSVAHANACQYCVAGHTALRKMEIFDNTDEQLVAVRQDKPFDDPKLDALRDFALLVLRNQGRMASSQLQAFLEAGYSRRAALDVVACIAAKVMTNYANQIALTPVDDAFAPFASDLPYREDRTVRTGTIAAE
ncbi:carboxymuconolactone decarboxylase family protein [Aestuariibius insulae]|uniref:carboxymuconolactone decarboxylase family protein n=1 Tax=Aestuariibius insulae TaxID=2058287 RepID=UPI00345EC0E5